MPVILVGLLIFRRHRRHFRPLGVIAPPVAVHNRLPGHQIHHAAKLILGPNRHLYRHRVALQTPPHRVNRALVRRPHPVHLVHKADARHIVGIRLPPHRFRLRLHPGHGVQHHNAAVQHPQAAFHLGGKVHMTRRVNDIDLMVVPGGGGGGGGNRNAPFLLLGHPVHRRGAFVNAAHLADAARQVKRPLGYGSLAGVNVGNKPDVADALRRSL